MHSTPRCTNGCLADYMSISDGSPSAICSQISPYFPSPMVGAARGSRTAAATAGSSFATAVGAAFMMPNLAPKFDP